MYAFLYIDGILCISFTRVLAWLRLYAQIDENALILRKKFPWFWQYSWFGAIETYFSTYQEQDSPATNRSNKLIANK